MGAHEQFVMQMGGGLKNLAKEHSLKFREATVLSTLILFDGPEGCHPTQEDIADAAGTTRGVVVPALDILEAAGLIKRRTVRYWDSRRRERHSKNHVYTLSEKIGEALEFASETLELKRRSKQPSLFSDYPMRATANHIGIPDVIDSQSHRDHVSPSLEPQEAYNDYPMRATANHIGIPDVIDSQSHRDPMRATVDPYIGGGGDKKDYLQMIRSFTPTPPPTTEQRELSLKILLHPAIAMSRTFAQAIAARFSPRSILDRCQVYSADHGAGRVNGVGLLIHRFAHAADRPIRQVQYDEPFDCEWYSEMNYLVEVDEGLWDEEEQMDVAPVEEPVARSALVQTAALAAPETVEAVFNTLEIEEPSETSTETRAETKEEKVDDVTRARDVELRDLEDELRVRLQDRRVHIEQDEYDAVRGKYQAIRRQRRRIEEMWSDERWHERARSARESGERFVDVLADLVAQRWPDFPYQIEWGLRLEKMAEAYKQVGRRGKELLDDILTASASEDKNMALMLLMAQWLTPDEETSDDDHDNLQRSAIPRVPAGQAHVPALQEAEIAESVPRPQRERRRPHPAVQGVP